MWEESDSSSDEEGAEGGAAGGDEDSGELSPLNYHKSQNIRTDES